MSTAGAPPPVPGDPPPAAGEHVPAPDGTATGGPGLSPAGAQAGGEVPGAEGEHGGARAAAGQRLAPGPGVVHQHGQASGEARVYQAARDLHVHHADGVSSALTRTDPARLECPYPGMAAFGPDQAQWFFGRAGQVNALLAKLDERRERGGELVVVAPSGAGKSSLLRAGVVPRLKAGALPGSQYWPCLELAPGERPLTALASQAAAVLGTSPGLLTGDGPDRFRAAVAEALRDRRGAPGGRVVIVVDQLEELFTLCPDEEERHRFLAALADAARPLASGEPPAGGEPPPALVIYGLRAAFYSQCADYPPLWAALRDGQLPLTAMSGRELREAILFPAQAVGLEVAEGLIELLLSDLAADPDGPAGEPGSYRAGRLPLLAYALRATWLERRGHVLTVDGYRATGGIHRAVAVKAEETYRGLNEPGQQAARNLFLRLVKIGHGMEDTRRRVSRSELADSATDPIALMTALNAFTQQRLLLQEEQTAQITHEALLSAWPRLRRWIDQDRAGNIARQDLEDAAARWDQGQRQAAALYRGSVLETARKAAAPPHNRDLTGTAQAFLAASARQARRSSRLRRGAVALLTALTLVAAGTAGLALQERSAALTQRNAALANQAVAEAATVQDSQPGLARQLIAAAVHIKLTPEVAAALAGSDAIPQDIQVRANQFAYSPDSRLLAIAQGGTTQPTISEPRVLNGGFLLYDTTTLRQLSVRVIGHVPVSVAFAPSGRQLAVTTGSAVQFWDITSPRAPALAGSLHPAGGADTVAFSPDGRTLATANGGHSVLLWDLAGGGLPAAPVSRIDTGASYPGSLSFQPGGPLLSVGVLPPSDIETVQLWNVADPRRPARVPASLGRVYSSSFAPDGGHLVTDTGFGVRLWPVSARGKVGTARPLPAAAGAVMTNGTTYGPGDQIATAYDDGYIRIWDATDPGAPSLAAQLPDINANGSPQLAFSPDGNSLAVQFPAGTVNRGSAASAHHLSTIRIWHIADGWERGAAAAVRTGTGTAAVLAVSPDQHLLAAGGDSQIWLADVRDPRHPRPLATIAAPPDVNALAFSPDSGMLAAASGSALIVADVSGLLRHPGHPPVTRVPYPAGGAEVTALAFGPGGSLLAAGDMAGNVVIFALSGRTAAPVATAQGHGWVRSLVFIADSRGSLLATASLAGSVDLWDLPSMSGIRHAGHVAEPDQIEGLASPSGTGLLAGVARDDLLRIWAASKAHGFSQVRAVRDTGELVAVSASPDGRRLATLGKDQTARVYDLTRSGPVLSELINLGGTAGFDIQFLGNDMIAVTTSHATVDIWDLNPDMARRLCPGTGLTITRAAWHQDIPGLPYRPPCG